MKLAEALIERASRRRHLDALKVRMLGNARVQEGATPAETPEALLAEYERVAGEFLAFVRRINATNSVTELAPGVTLADAIAERDVLRLRQQAYADLASAATGTPEGRSIWHNGVRYERTVEVAALQKQADELARQARELDTRIQAANWAVELAT